MPETVKVPIAGNVDKRLAIGGAIFGIILGGWFYYRQKQASAATPPASAIDPATGEPYGTSADAAALAGQGGFIQAGNVGTTSDQAPPPQMPGFTSDSQWSQAAQQYLVDQGGGDPAVVGIALGRYVTGEPVTDAQKQIIDQAIAFEGYPPVGGPNGYPPGIRDAAPVPVPVPTVHATPLATPRLVTKSFNRGKTTAVLDWNAIIGAQFYILSGSRLPIVTTSTIATVAASRGKNAYGYHVRAYPAGYNHNGTRTDPKSAHTASAYSNAVHV